MKHFFLNIFKRYSQWIFSTWGTYLLLIFAMSKLNSESVTDLLLGLGFMLCSFVATILMSGTRWIVFWRNVASNLKEFWLGVFAVQIFSIVLNGTIFLVVSRFYVTGAQAEPFQLTSFDFMWGLIIAFSLSVTIMDDTKVMLANNSLRQSSQFFMSLGIYIFMLVVFPLLLYSRLLFYLVIEISILFWFLMRNTFVLGSIRKTTRHKFLLVSVLVSLVFSIGSYVLALDGLSGSQRFLGVLGPQKKTQFSELNSVDTPSLWVRWFSQVEVLDVQQTIIALSKLEDLCPPRPTDMPTIIQCFEKEPTNEGKSFNYPSLSVDASKVSLLLRDPHIYSKLFGLMAARSLNDFTTDINDAISSLAISGGRLAPVAELTLASHQKGQKGRISIVIESKK